MTGGGPPDRDDIEGVARNPGQQPVVGVALHPSGRSVGWVAITGRWTALDQRGQRWDINVDTGTSTTVYRVYVDDLPDSDWPNVTSLADYLHRAGGLDIGDLVAADLDDAECE